MGDSSRQEGLSGTWGSVEKHTLGLRNTQTIEDLWVLNGQLDHFLDLFDLLFETTDHVVGGVWNLLNLHQTDKWINFAGEDLM